MDMTLWNVLLVDDNEKDFTLINEYLSSAKGKRFLIDWVSDLPEALSKLANNSYDVVLVSDSAGANQGLAFIRQAVNDGCRIPFLFISGEESYEIDVEAMRAGAKDYLNKSELSPALLERSIRYAVEARKNLKALRDSEERFQIATRAVNGVVYDWDLATNTIFRSDGLKQVIGVHPSEITQTHGWWENRVHPEDYPLLEKTIDEKIRGTADDYELEYRVQHLQGHWINVWERAFIIRDENGKAVRVVGTRSDITGLKRAEQNSRFLATLGEQMLTQDTLDALFRYASETLMRHLNLNRISFDEIDLESETLTVMHERHLQAPGFVGSHPFSAFHRLLREQMVKGQPMVVADSFTDPLIAPFIDSFKEFNNRSFVAIPRITEDGWIATMIVVAGEPRQWRDDEVALLKQSSDLVWLAVENARLLKQLRETQERFEVALKNSQITVYMTDMDRRYTWITNSNLPSRAETVIGKRDDEVLNQDDFHEVIEAKKTVLATGVGIQKVFVVTFQNRKVYLDMTIEPLRNPFGEMEGLIVAVSDKTQRYEIEEQIQETADQLEIQRRMEELREKERQQIARDLHDGPIQSMIGLLFSIKTVQSILQDGQASEMLASVQEETQRLVGELRSLCNELRPPVLVQFGLSSAIRSHAAEFQQRHPEITIHLRLIDAGRMLQDNIRLALYRIYQEALNNIVRHSNATEVTVILSMNQQNMVLEISDNGDGFQMPGEYINLAREGHFGLVGMRERAEAIGGTLNVVSSLNEGTHIIVSVSVVEMAENRN